MPDKEEQTSDEEKDESNFSDYTFGQSDQEEEAKFELNISSDD